MDKILNNKLNFKEKILLFYKKNKIKTFFLFFLFFASTIGFNIFNEKQREKEIQLSEIYIKAGLLLNNDQNKEATNQLEEIILSKNSFYSLLALNTIIEKELVNDKEKVLKYFAKIEKANLSEEQQDLLQFKKALYLIKLEDFENGKKILNILIKNNSKFKMIAQDIIND